MVFKNWLTIEFLMTTIFTFALILKLLSAGPYILFSETAVLGMFIYACHMKAFTRTTDTLGPLTY